MADDKLAGGVRDEPRPDRTTAAGRDLATGVHATNEPVATLPPAMPTAAMPFGAALPEPAIGVMATIAGVGAPSHAPPPIAPARYVLGNEIARGGMGRVVEATDTVLGRVVAYKETLVSDVDTLRRFEREIRITARLEHPSIVPVHDAGAAPGGPAYYVMRKVSGRPLERLVGSAETLGERLALLPHIVDSAQAIAHAHERGIVHRDIKPSNILVGELGETVVIDWGLAKVIGEPDEQIVKPLVDLDDTLKTRAGIVYGTPGFMAPEQLRGAPVHEGCDVYALGATLYHLLARKPPHYAKTADEMMKAAVAAPPQPVRELVSGVPPELSTIVDKALAHDPKVRYRNARALAEDLHRFLSGQLIAAHHYSRREKLVRLIRRNRGLAAAVAALVLVGSVAVVRIVVERNRADAAAHIAETQRAEAVRRTEELLLAHARDNVDVNPTKAVAMLKPLATRYWREVRAIAAAARTNGVAWGIEAAAGTRSLELSHDGRRALSAGNDGALRIHDLAARTTRELATLRVPVTARFADSERRVVAWHDATLAIIDAATGAVREVATASTIEDLAIVAATAYWVDAGHNLWQLDLATGEPTAIVLDEPVRAVAPSPDGRWIALAGQNHLLLYDRQATEEPTREVTLGDTRHIGWAADGGHFAALVDRSVIDIAMVPVPTIVNRQIVGARQFVAHSGGYMYTVGATDMVVMKRTDWMMEPTARKQLRGDAVGLSVARDQTLVAGATGGLTLISDEGDRVLPLATARVEAVAASPRSPYVIAQLEHRLLVWNLDDIQPRRLAERPAGGARFAGADQVIVGGSPESPAIAIDVATAAARPLGDWPGLHTVAGGERGVAIVDDNHRVHVVRPGRPAEDLPGAIDIAGFTTPDRLVLATLDGAIAVHDLARDERTPLVPPRSRLLGLAWGRGHHPWIAALFADGALWRKNVQTGDEATIPRSPPLGPSPTNVDGTLVVAADGTVTYVAGRTLHAWRDNAIAPIAELAKPITELAEAGPGHLLTFAGDGTIFAIATTPDHRVTSGIPGIIGGSAAVSADTGLLVVVDHGELDVIDPLARQRWTLGWPERVKFDSPAISADGRRILARTQTSLLVWSLALPDGPEATAAWLDAMTNAVDDPSPGGLGWR